MFYQNRKEIEVEGYGGVANKEVFMNKLSYLTLDESSGRKVKRNGKNGGKREREREREKGREEKRREEKRERLQLMQSNHARSENKACHLISSHLSSAHLISYHSMEERVMGSWMIGLKYVLNYDYF